MHCRRALFVHLQNKKFRPYCVSIIMVVSFHMLSSDNLLFIVNYLQVKNISVRLHVER